MTRLFPHVYFFRGMLWMQSELTYGDDGTVKDLLKTYSAFIASKPGVPALVDKLYNDAVIPKIFRIVLKPSRVWSFLFRRGKEFDAETFCIGLKNSEVAKVLADFFTLNKSLISGLIGLSSLLDFDGLVKVRAMMQAPSPLNTLFSAPAKDASTKPKES